MRNGPNTLTTLDLPFQSEVHIWREKGGLLATQSIEAQQEGCRQACTIGLSINEDTKLRKGKEDRWCRGPVQISRGRQGASSKRANGHVAEYGRSFVRSFCHMTPSPPSSTVFRQCRNINVCITSGD